MIARDSPVLVLSPNFFVIGNRQTHRESMMMWLPVRTMIQPSA